MYLFLDTETNTLPDYKKDADADGQPRLAEFAMLLTDAGFNITGEYHSYIQPDVWQMQPDATAKNGLTDDFLIEHGRPIETVLAVYTTAIKEGRSVIAHNAQFDCKIMRGELRRAGQDDLFEQTPNFCTMRGKGIMKLGIKKLNGKGGFPRLPDLCAHYGVDFEETHKAAADVIGLHRAVQKMVAAGFLIEPEVHYSKNLEAIRANKGPST